MYCTDMNLPSLLIKSSTALVRHPDYYSGHRDLTATSANRVITSSVTAAWLRQNHGHRIFATLVEQRHDSVSTIHLDDEDGGIDQEESGGTDERLGKKRKLHNGQEDGRDTEERWAKKRWTREEIEAEMREFVEENKGLLDSQKSVSSCCKHFKNE